MSEGRTPNKNLPWMKSELETLHQMWASKSTLEEMAVAVGRTAAGTAYKLAHLKYVYFHLGTMSYYLAGEKPKQALWTTSMIRNLDKKLQEDPYKE